MVKIGPTGERLAPPLNEHDEGALIMAIGPEDGRVVIRFGKNVSWVGMGPWGAREMARRLIDAANQAENETN